MSYRDLPLETLLPEFHPQDELYRFHKEAGGNLPQMWQDYLKARNVVDFNKLSKRLRKKVKNEFRARILATQGIPDSFYPIVLYERVF